jgi:hypothetical protein
MFGDVLKFGTIVVIPAIVALVVSLGWRRLLRASVAADAALAVGGAAGFFIGYVLLPDWAALAPVRHWHWLPYLALVVTVAGGITVAVRSPLWGSGLLMFLLGAITAWMLVPTWVHTGRTTTIPLFAGYLGIVACLLLLLPARLRGRHFVLLLTTTLLAAALVVTVEVSLMYGEVAGVAMAVMAGLWGALIWFVRTNRTAARTATTAGAKPAKPAAPLAPLTDEGWSRLTLAIIPLYVLLAGGISFVGAIEPSQPVYAFLLIPAAPLALWLFTLAPLRGLAGWQAIVAQTVAVAIIPLAVLGWILFNHEPNEWGQTPRPDQEKRSPEQLAVLVSPFAPRPAKQVARVHVPVVVAGATQQSQDQLIVASLSTRDQATASRGGGAGLHTLETLGPQHAIGVVPGDGSFLVLGVERVSLMATGLHNITQQRMLQGAISDLREVRGARVVLPQAMRIEIASLLQLPSLGLPIHLGHEGFGVAVGITLLAIVLAAVLGKRGRRIVARGEQQAVQQFLDFQPISSLNLGRRTFGLGSRRRDRERLFQNVGLRPLQVDHQPGRHDFRRAGHDKRIVLAFSPQELTTLAIDKRPALGRHQGRSRQLVGHDLGRQVFSLHNVRHPHASQPGTTRQAGCTTQERTPCRSLHPHLLQQISCAPQTRDFVCSAIRSQCTSAIAYLSAYCNQPSRRQPARRNEIRPLSRAPHFPDIER